MTEVIIVSCQQMELNIVNRHTAAVVEMNGQEGHQKMRTPVIKTSEENGNCEREEPSVDECAVRVKTSGSPQISQS